MLKIYLRKITYEIHNEGKVEYLNSGSHYVIREEEMVTSETVEWDAYSDEAHNAYGPVDVWHRKKGNEIKYIAWYNSIYLKQWRSPNAKLVKHITYKERDCSMKELMDLPSADVIAYLKQEGMGLIMPT